MIGGRAKQSELIDKLLRLARGNLDLVEDAIRTSTNPAKGSADLAVVVAHIQGATPSPPASKQLLAREG